MKFQTIISRIDPVIRKKIIFLLFFLVLFTIVVWICVFSVSSSFPFFLGLASLAYGFGLRHAVDADHIAAIDNTTRKLMQDGQKPVAVGLFFSLGHSTIVILLSGLLAFSTSFINGHLPAFRSVGSIIGTSVSAVFLLLIGMINLVVFIDIFRIWRHVTKGGHFKESHIDEHLHRTGLIARFLKPLLRTITKSWQMYLIGILFGLGFDTATEVGLLSISASSTTTGLLWYQILLLPLAFTVGMALIDAIDGILMLGAYGWAYIKPVRKLYYNLNITFISVFIALFIGSIEGLQVISKQTGIDSGIFAVANSLQFDFLGYIIIAAFLLSWLFSVLIYKLRKYDKLDIHHNNQNA